MAASAPWLAHYDADVPATLGPYPQKTLVDFVAEWARSRPQQAALLFKGTSVSWAELDHLSDACAAAFASFGVKRGDRIALLLPNCPQFFIAELGAWKLGAIAAPLNPIYSEPELEAALQDNGAETIVTLTRFYQRVKRVQPRTALRHVVATNIKAHFPPLLRWLFTIAREKRDGDRVTLTAGDSSLETLLGAQPREPRPGMRPSPDEPAVLLMSGGTTGSPKAAIGTHSAYVQTGVQIKAWNQSALGADGADVCFCPLPLFHVYANVGLQALAFVNGSALALVPNPRDLNDLVATVRRVKPTFFNGVPTLYIALLNHPAVQRGKVDFRSIRLCFSGASALLADTKQRFEALTGARIVEGYSLTEAMMALCINPANGPNKLGSVGMPLPDVAVRICDPEDAAQQLPPGSVGEIAIAGKQLMTGYWNQRAETEAVIRCEPDGTRWLYTGDLGYMDEDGYVFIVDRKKDMIKTSGFQVWPREVEEVLAAHPAVAEVGVAGMPDPVKGEVAKAWVVLRAGQSVTEAELRAYCKEKLAPYKVPPQIAFRTELPKTMVGKVLRRKLRESLGDQ